MKYTIPEKTNNSKPPIDVKNSGNKPNIYTKNPIVFKKPGTNKNKSKKTKSDDKITKKPRDINKSNPYSNQRRYEARSEKYGWDGDEDGDNDEEWYDKCQDYKEECQVEGDCNACDDGEDEGCPDMEYRDRPPSCRDGDGGGSDPPQFGATGTGGTTYYNTPTFQMQEWDETDESDEEEDDEGNYNIVNCYPGSTDPRCGVQRAAATATAAARATAAAAAEAAARDSAGPACPIILDQDFLNTYGCAAGCLFFDARVNNGRVPGILSGFSSNHPVVITEDFPREDQFRIVQTHEAAQWTGAPRLTMKQFVKQNPIITTFVIRLDGEPFNVTLAQMYSPRPGFSGSDNPKVLGFKFQAGILKDKTEKYGYIQWFKDGFDCGISNVYRFRLGQNDITDMYYSKLPAGYNQRSGVNLGDDTVGGRPTHPTQQECNDACGDCDDAEEMGFEDEEACNMCENDCTACGAPNEDKQNCETSPSTTSGPGATAPDSTTADCDHDCDQCEEWGKDDITTELKEYFRDSTHHTIVDNPDARRLIFNQLSQKAQGVVENATNACDYAIADARLETALQVQQQLSQAGGGGDSNWYQDEDGVWREGSAAEETITSEEEMAIQSEVIPGVIEYILRCLHPSETQEERHLRVQRIIAGPEQWRDTDEDELTQAQLDQAEADMIEHTADEFRQACNSVSPSGENCPSCPEQQECPQQTECPTCPEQQECPQQTECPTCPEPVVTGETDIAREFLNQNGITVASTEDPHQTLTNVITNLNNSKTKAYEALQKLLGDNAPTSENINQFIENTVPYDSRLSKNYNSSKDLSGWWTDPDTLWKNSSDGYNTSIESIVNYYSYTMTDSMAQNIAGPGISLMANKEILEKVMYDLGVYVNMMREYENNPNYPRQDNSVERADIKREFSRQLLMKAYLAFIRQHTTITDDCMKDSIALSTYDSCNTTLTDLAFHMPGIKTFITNLSEFNKARGGTGLSPVIINLLDSRHEDTWVKFSEIYDNNGLNSAASFMSSGQYLSNTVAGGRFAGYQPTASDGALFKGYIKEAITSFISDSPPPSWIGNSVWGGQFLTDMGLSSTASWDNILSAINSELKKTEQQEGVMSTPVKKLYALFSFILLNIGENDEEWMVTEFTNLLESRHRGNNYVDTAIKLFSRLGATLEEKEGTVCNISTNTVTELGLRLDTKESELATAQADLTTAQSDLTIAQADLATAQADLATAQQGVEAGSCDDQLTDIQNEKALVDNALRVAAERQKKSKKDIQMRTIGAIVAAVFAVIFLVLYLLK